METYIKKDANSIYHLTNFFSEKKDLTAELDNYPNDIKLEVVGKANLNTWMGNITPQIFVEQIDIKEDKLLDF